MFSTISTLFIDVVVTVLKAVIKNPTSVAEEKSVIANLAQLATQADTAVNGTVWTSTSGTPAP